LPEEASNDMKEEMTDSILEEIKRGNIYNFLVDSRWQPSQSGKTLEIFSPIDGHLVGKVQALTTDEVDRAVKSAKEAQKEWGNTPTWQRAELMHQAARNLEATQKEVAAILVEEVGKPIKSASKEIIRTVELIDYYAEEARRMFGESLWSDAWPGYEKTKLAIAERVPIGAVVAIPPFNYPVNETAPKVVAALAAGNTCVLKPPSQGAISAIHLAQCFQAAGLPANVLQVVTGRGSKIGDTLVTHPDVACINFTGGTKTAKHIAYVATFQKLVMGLSGKDAAIVLADADLDLAASEIMSGAFSFAAQRCTAVKRVIVAEKVASELVKRLRDLVEKKLILGDPRDEETSLGPVISDKVADYVQDLMEDALSKGTKVVCGGKRFTLKNGKLVPDQEDGLYFEATILDKVTSEMKVAWEEPFGPILPIERVKGWQEAVVLANQSEYGLQSSVFTRDVNKAFKIAQMLEVGSVQINAKDARGPDHFPFLGTKHSGMGMVQGARYLLTEMTRWKTTVVNFPKGGE
jgi:glyceraldehyde-3-phosphate dehydrogenase (NADP+)